MQGPPRLPRARYGYWRALDKDDVGKLLHLLENDLPPVRRDVEVPHAEVSGEAGQLPFRSVRPYVLRNGGLGDRRFDRREASEQTQVKRERLPNRDLRRHSDGN